VGHDHVGARSAAGTAALIAQCARFAAAPPPMKCRVIAIDGPVGALSRCRRHRETE
jgi:hypothetical protein